MSFFSKLFGGGQNKNATESTRQKILGEEEYKGYTIQAVAMKQGNEFLLAGNIIKTVDGQEISKKFIRADRLSNEEQACSTALKKGRQIIDQDADRFFDSKH